MARKQHLIWIVVVLCATTGTACLKGKATGGGWLISTDGVSRANFGFNGSKCGLFPQGNMNFHDTTAAGFADVGGVKVNGPATAFLVCEPGKFLFGCALCPDTDSNRFLMKFAYQSTNPAVPGSGDLFACVANGGAIDHIVVRVDTGPFAGYFNAGELEGGNIQEHDCTCKDGIDNDGDGRIDLFDPDCRDPVTGFFNPNLDESGLR
jgi:hypothetical protein